MGETKERKKKTKDALEKTLGVLAACSCLDKPSSFHPETSRRLYNTIRIMADQIDERNETIDKLLKTQGRYEFIAWLGIAMFMFSITRDLYSLWH